jgi:Putative bacterial sensory transduction regulator
VGLAPLRGSLLLAAERPQSNDRLIGASNEEAILDLERRAGRPEPEEVRAAAVAAVAAFLAEAGLEAEELGDGRWFVRLSGERKLGIGVHLAVGDRTLRVESFFMRAPEEQQERLYRELLLRQATSYVLRFTLDEAGDLFLIGQVPLRAVTAEEVDRIVGTVLDLADAAYLPAVEVGFASSIAAEKAWRARLAEGSGSSP